MLCILQMQLDIQQLIWTLHMGTIPGQASAKTIRRMETVMMLLLTASPLAVERATLCTLPRQLNTKRLS